MEGVERVPWLEEGGTEAGRVERLGTLAVECLSVLALEGFPVEGGDTVEAFPLEGGDTVEGFTVEAGDTVEAVEGFRVEAGDTVEGFTVEVGDILEGAGAVRAACNFLAE